LGDTGRAVMHDELRKQSASAGSEGSQYQQSAKSDGIIVSVVFRVIMDDEKVSVELLKQNQ